MLPEKLPEFKNPPVVETILGVQFTPLSKIQSAHLGAFWKRLGPEWSIVEDTHPIPESFEMFDEKLSWISAGLKLELTKRPEVRLKIKNQKNNGMIQIQNNRFHFNWLGHNEREEYPRYKVVQPQFLAYWSKFREFVREENLGEIIPNQWEITYINHIPCETVWNTIKDWDRMLNSSILLNVSPVPDVTLIDCVGEWHYEIKPQLGRLHVVIRRGKESKGKNRELIIMRLTARGPIDADKEQIADIKNGLDLGHQVIVLSFKNLTSEYAHQYWELIHGNSN